MHCETICQIHENFLVFFGQLMHLSFNSIYNESIWRPDFVDKFVTHSVVFIDAKCKTMVMPELAKIEVDCKFLVESKIFFYVYSLIVPDNQYQRQSFSQL